MSPSAGSLATVTVLYHPDAAAIAQLETLSQSNLQVVAVINSITVDLETRLRGVPNIDILSNESNVGLAKALNQGMALAFSRPEVDFVLLLDQDSTPENELAHALASRLRQAHANGLRPACIAPMLRDVKSLRAAVLRVDPAARSNSTDLLTPVSVATSGTLIERSAFERVGPMLEPLFIDGIDHEWCFRARAAGLVPLVARHIVMDHNMGDDAIQIFGKFKPLHRSPIRHYYIVRNSLILARAPYIPTKWKILEAFKTLRRIVAYLLISSSTWLTFKLIFQGVFDGIRGQAGKLGETTAIRFNRKR